MHPLTEYAEYALQRCSDWFGPPGDHSWKHTLVFGSTSYCHREILKRRYTISISTNRITLADQCWTIGHEMYHRVTVLRTGMWLTPWMDEMLASQASLQLLEEKEMSEYVDHLLRHYRASPKVATIEEIENAGDRWNRLGNNTSPLADRIYATVACLGAAFESLVGWEALCRLGTSLGWQEWLQSLPEDRRILVGRFLSFCSTDDLTPLLGNNGGAPGWTAEQHREIAWALYQNGNWEKAAAECEAAIRLEPDRVTAYRYLGTILYESGQLEKAIEAWQQYLLRKADNPLIYFNLGVACYQCGRLEIAQEYLEEAARLRPAHEPAQQALAVLKAKMASK